METEDYEHHHHQPQNYALTTDLTQLQRLIMNSPTSIQQPPPQLTTEELVFPGHQNLLLSPLPSLATTTTITNNHHHYDDEMMMTMIGGCDDDMIMVPCGPSVSTPPPSSDGGLGLEKGEGAGGCIDGDESIGRWRKKETLTLLEIRSRVDPKFKQPNQKGHLWEEVSRIMCEEHGYQRSGKKCKEKFENLHKYYKNTKDSAATHHQDNNNHYYHYYCDNSIINFSELFDFDDTSISSDHNNNNNNNNDNSIIDDDEKRRKKKKRKSSSDYNNNNNWKVKKMRDLIDSEMRKVMEKQEEWLEKVVKVFEEKEKERVLREEIWRKEEEIRFENEHKFWAMKREWIEARDSVLMDALKKLKGITSHNNNNNNNHGNNGGFGVGGSYFSSWHGCDDEITRIQQQSLCFEEEQLVANSIEKWESGINNNDEAIQGKGNIIMKQKGKSRSNFLCFDDNVAQ